ncbi:hypothetical protein [Sphingomonas sp. KR3-1]|uniref:hypothetical protein n=1 Tax=Sphingomonas sp. KR3-1 TaxID=3156611 RepID=UPI0032B3CBE4
MTADSGSGTDGTGGGSTATADNGSGGTGSGAGSGSGNRLGGNLLVASGNAVMGAANAQTGLTAGLGVPADGVVTGTVNRVLGRTGQTLVSLGNGSTLLLDGKGGKLGDLVSIDLGQGKVVGASSASASPLVGLNVLARNPSTGQLATVSAATAGNLASVTVPNGQGGQLLNVAVPGNLGNTAGGAGGLLNGVTGATNANANVTGAATTALGNVNATVNGVVNPQGASAGANANTNLVGGTVNAVGGLVNGLTPKPR